MKKKNKVTRKKIIAHNKKIACNKVIACILASAITLTCMPSNIVQAVTVTGSTDAKEDVGEGKYGEQTTVEGSIHKGTAVEGIADEGIADEKTAGDEVTNEEATSDSNIIKIKYNPSSHEKSEKEEIAKKYLKTYLERIENIKKLKRHKAKNSESVMPKKESLKK